jgi:putative transposase
MSYISSFFHIVISTSERRNTLTESHIKDLFAYIWGIVKKRNCQLIRINGVQNHIHLLISMNSSTSVSDLVHDIKRDSSIWLKRNSDFPLFEGWSKEYAAFSVSYGHVDMVKQYIINQQEHHKQKSAIDEETDLLREYGLKPYTGNRETSSR